MKTNDIVSKADGSKTNGRVKYVVCFACTTKGGATCNKKTCNDPNNPTPCPNAKDHVFVEWGDGKTYSYNQNELVVQTTASDLLNDVLGVPEVVQTKPETDKKACDEAEAKYQELIRQGLPKDWNFDIYNRTLPGANGRLLPDFGSSVKSRR